ncbi:carbohydrate sulfotransferase 11-like [Panulirus ornatus]|uniref:carbohydrate sulfotransferase 11-like n=1 Tax=Panulirus ornatus TaxID=150431 RepID=UPI003A845023
MTTLGRREWSKPHTGEAAQELAYTVFALQNVMTQNYSEVGKSTQASVTSAGDGTRKYENDVGDSDERMYNVLSQLAKKLENHESLSDSKTFYRLKGKTSQKASLKELPSRAPTMNTTSPPYERSPTGLLVKYVSTKDLYSKVPRDEDFGSIISLPQQVIKNISLPEKLSSQKIATGVDLARAISLPEVLSNKDPPPLRPSINLKKRRERKADSPLVVLPRDKYWPTVLEPSDGAIFASINFSRYTPEDRQYLQEHVGVYEERARLVSKVCRKNPALASPVIIQTLVWDQKHHPNIVWCEISKVASSSWMINFLRLAHYRENDASLSSLPQQERDALRFEESQFEAINVHFLVYRRFPAPSTTKERSRVFRHALRLLIVRHPFSRLLSAYMDKMMSITPKPEIFNFRELQLEIIRRYRPKNSNETLLFPTFEEFVQYVIDSTASLKTLKDWKKMVCWTPYWAHCGVCSHDYQFIMKLETIVEDERFLVTLADLQELKQVHEWRNSKSSANTTHSFFQQLSTHQMQQLHQRYMLDFQLFGYSIDEYLPLAKDAT